MRIFDCFMFYDEEVVLDIRLNSLKNFVDCFVIVESKFYHNGKKRDLKFDINKLKRFTVENDTSYIDTSLTIKKFYKFNYIRKDDFELVKLNNVGQIYNQLTYNPSKNNLLSFGFNANNISFKFAKKEKTHFITIDVQSKKRPFFSLKLTNQFMMYPNLGAKVPTDGSEFFANNL